ncbi:cysteine--tRNA ligase CPS1 homolog, chloroplastic/mitochondrial-like isoform X2 [Mercurialis annua]|uniref:cysteine--tRNA ligase CPS1 homolog, chloroplastic/mitochondrial-like isoform X2 n=1 Tax=Mercurialis annua TaxID=3986 RepID=UPI0024AD3BF9|nr:cysteine--tRNA ligase CPS1 homolog, chloroplastic/mitochondrial-like isoform X2 [Mercurialis annua]
MVYVYLHCLPPFVEPRVSDYIPHIIDMIKQILDNGCAYAIEGDVYFSVDRFPEYGKLSGSKLEDNRAGERVAVDSRKNNPADFALWKVIDLYHPMACGFSCWGFTINLQSINLVYSLRVLLRIFFYIYQTLYDCETVIGLHKVASDKDSVPTEILNCINTFHYVSVSSMSDDLHTPVLLAALSDPLKIINDMLHTRKGKKQTKRVESLAVLEKTIGNALSILGLMPTTYFEFKVEWKIFSSSGSAATERKSTAACKVNRRA